MSTPAAMSAPAAMSTPNFLFIMADDLGFSDLGCFGSEIATPHLDRLAQRGVRMSSFYCAPFCSPSRAMLHTGLDAHLVGFGALKEVIDPRQAGKPGYEMYLNDRAPTLAERLRRAGYVSWLSGKWHLGRQPAHWPGERGFDESFGLVDGSASHFDDTATWSDDPDGDPKALFQQNGRPIRFRDHGSYSSEAYADWLIARLRSHRGDRPFFAMLNFTAPHFPLHAPDAFIAPYLDTYRAGYGAIQSERWQRQQAMGFFDGVPKPAQRSALWPQWDALPAPLRELEARNMAVYAGMVSCMDHHIGRVVEALEQTGRIGDTVIVFLSDNGAEGNSVLDTARTRDWVRRRMDNRLDNRGRPGSFIEQGPGWAQVSNTPLRLYKSFTYEGGIRVPLIAAVPGETAAGRILSACAHVTDLLPTVLDLAGVETTHPWPREVPPLPGRSMRACWAGRQEAVHSAEDALGCEMQGRNALRLGGWKIVHCNRPWGTEGWELYDVERDPGEQVDLAARHPDIVESLLRHWHRYVLAHGVVTADDLSSSMVYSNARRYYEDLAFDAG
ncbi:MAG: arylsulfatase [Burkholderiaceae bacterium]